MLGTTENCLSNLRVFFSEWVVNNTEAATVLDGKTDEYRHSRQITLDKVIGTVKWVNPDYGISRVKRLKVLDLDVIFVIILSKSVSNPIAASLLGLVEIFS